MQTAQTAQTASQTAWLLRPDAVSPRPEIHIVEDGTSRGFFVAALDMAWGSPGLLRAATLTLQEQGWQLAEEWAYVDGGYVAPLR